MPFRERKLLKVLVLGAVHGFLIALLLILALLSAHEDELYDQIVAAVVTNQMNDTQAAQALVATTHKLLQVNHAIIAGTKSQSFRQRYVNSSDVQLASPKGNCGSYTHVLARLLQRAGFRVRIAQMDCSNSEKSCHIIAEALIDQRYVVLDGMYDHTFSKSDGTLATFNEVSQNWSRYRPQLPDDYPEYFDYHQVRYTNWQKIPILMPAIKKLLDWTMGRDAQEISLRPYLLNLYKVYFLLLCGLYLMLTLLYIWKVARRRRKFLAVKSPQ